MFSKFDEARFLENVRKQRNGCWLWDAGYSGNGSPAFWVEGRVLSAHRFAYLYYKGDVPAGLKVMRTCNTATCVNPDHLTVATLSEILHQKRAGNAGKTACHKGHEFTPENTRITRDRRRACRTCEAERMRRRREESQAFRNLVLKWS